MPSYRKNNQAVEGVVKRFEASKVHREYWVSHWRECYEQALPQRETVSLHQPGAKKNATIYDSTALVATQRFASRLQSTLVPPFKQWAKLEAGSVIPKDQTGEINQQLEEMSEIMFSHINQSNLATEANEAFLDLAVGTGALLLEEGVDGNLLKFTAVPLSELIVEEGPHGTIETVFREHSMPARNIERTWANGKPSDQVKRQIEEKPDTLVELIEGTIFNPDKQTYEFVVIEAATKHVVWEDYFDVSPWIVFRWSKVAGERYGRGPIMSALPDIKTLNLVAKYVLKNAEKSIAGVYVGVDDGVLNPWTVKIAPGVVIPVAAEGSLSPLPSAGDFNVSQFVMEDLKESIRKALFYDQLGPVAGPTKSATEIAIRQQELMSDIGSSFGRLQTEFITKLVRRSIDILKRNGIVPDVQVDGKAIEVRVISPLARAQDMEDISNLGQFIQMASLAGPEATALGVDLEAIPEWIGKKMGIDLDLLRTPAQREEMKQQAMQAQLAAQAVQEGGLQAVA